VAATHEQLREGFDRWLRQNPEGLMERGRNHSQANWPKEWEAAGYPWFAPPVCPRCGKNMMRSTHRSFSLNDGTETTIITFYCKSAHKPSEQAFRSVAGEIAKPIGGGRGRGGVYEIERDGKVLRTCPRSSAAAVIAYQKKKRAAREAAEHQERVERYGPDAAENWDNLTHGDKIALAWDSRTPERRKEWASNIRQAQMQPERQALRSKVSKEMWTKRAAEKAELDQRVRQAEQDAIDARRVAEEKEATFAALKETAKKAWRPDGFEDWPLWQQKGGEYLLKHPAAVAPEVACYIAGMGVSGPWGKSSAVDYARTENGRTAFKRLRRKMRQADI
jgi:hypothetical protein